MAALQQPRTSPPRPDQFVYSETRDPSGWISRIWLAADGERPGLTGNGDVIPSDESCSVGYLSDLPTDPSQVFSYLTLVGLIAAGASNNAIGKTVLFLLQSVYLLATQRAGLYQFLLAIPSFTRVPSAVDAIGREGVGISWSVPSGDTTEIIFDPTTYSYLGARTRSAASFKGPTDSYNGSALITMAVVDRAGEIPSSS